MRKTGKKHEEKDKSKDKSRKQYKFYGGRTQTFYFRILMATSLAICFVLLMNAFMTYIFQNRQLEQLEDQNALIRAQHVQASVDILNERTPTPGMSVSDVETFVASLLHEDYVFSVYPTFNEMNSDISVDLTPEQEMMVKGRKIVQADNVTVFRLADYYMAMAPKAAAAENTARVWYRVLWTTGIATIVLALLVNTFTTLWVTRPIKAISDAMQEIVNGNFDVKINVDGEDEIAALQKTFNMMTEKLKENEQMSKDFVSTVSHEYKTPIAAISGYATLLYEGGVSEKDQKEYLKIILEQTKRLSGLSVNMLQLARLDSGVVGLDKREYRLDEQIRKVVVTLEHHWVEKEIELDIDLDDVTVFANEQMLYHVWENLISNAIKFTPLGGFVAIKLHAENRKAVFSVKDDGCGIPKEDIDKIWQRFYKSKADVNSGGNGLGLPISKRIVELSGGTISVTSEEGKGSEFIVELPL